MGGEKVNEKLNDKIKYKPNYLSERICVRYTR